MRQKYTIEDIAQRAGVSRGTVSRVLNDYHAVSDETRQAVLDVIEQLGYRPNFSARHMRTNSSKLVGFSIITDEIVTTMPYAVELISGAEDALLDQGKVMLVVNAGYTSAMAEASLEALLERRVEGIIYAAWFHREVEIPSEISQVPVVLANCFSKDRRFSSAVPDEVGGGYAATNLLLRKGHTRIGFINLGVPVRGLPPIVAAAGRLTGYQKALAEYNIPFDASLVKYTNHTPQMTVQLTIELMTLPDPPTAIFCGNDRTAIGCYNALGAMHLRIPDDVAVVGFDNQEPIAAYLWPPLTTVQLPHYEMGRWAAEYLLSATDGSAAPVQQLIPCPLVERESA